MKKLYIIFTIAALLFGVGTKAQKKSDFKVKFKGYVNYEMIWDSRQAVAARDGDVLLYPASEKLDPDGKDINANSSFNALAINSRLQMVITGPEAFGAKTSGMISGDFFGTANDKVGVFRLRQAFVKLNWENTELLAGKAWHPLFATEVFPKVLSFGAAIPFYPLSRAPQLRYRVKMNKFEWLAAISTQQDFVTAGPGGRKPSFLSNSGTPEFSSRLMYKGDKLLLGVGAGYWSVTPKLETATGYATDEKVSGMMINSFAKLDLPKVTIRGGYLYGENMSNLFMFGGIGVNSVSQDGKSIETYEPTSALSVWGEIETKNKGFNVGLFAGYTKNQGADKAITGDLYGVGTNIDSYYRISPRASYTSGKVRLGLELIYHCAAYGDRNDYGKVVNTNDVDAVRLLSSVTYFF